MPLTASQQFDRDWSYFHPGRVPLGWHLWQNEMRPWVRFHALPKSKRYAETKMEADTIRLRANLLGERILGSGSPCWIVEHRRQRSESAGEFWRSIIMDSWTEDQDPEDYKIHFYVREDRWEWDRYHIKLTDIADDRPDSRALWVRRDNGAIFAPYDGGFDLFPATWPEVGALRAERRDWLSETESGL